MCDLSMTNIRELTDPNAIEKLYALACEEDGKAQARLGEWHSDDVDRVLRQMDGLRRAQLQPLEQSLASIRDGLSGPRKSAATISGSIHSVVSVRARVESTSGRIEEIIDIKNCMRTVRQAIDAGEYETAAKSIFKYLQLDDAVLDAQSRTLLHAAQQEMKAIVNAKLDELSGRKAFSSSSSSSHSAASPSAASLLRESADSATTANTLVPQPLPPTLSPVTFTTPSSSTGTSPMPSDDERLGRRMELLEDEDKFVKRIDNEGESITSEEEREKLLRKYCRMCYQLGAEEEGLARYTGYLRLACSRKADAIIRDLNKHMIAQQRMMEQEGMMPSQQQQQQQLVGEDGGKVVSYVDALTKICENVADTAQSQMEGGGAEAPLWPGSIFPVLNALQVQCDIDGCRVLDMFLDRFSVAQRIAEINQSRRSSLDIHTDPRTLPPIIEEISFLCQTISVFSNFLDARERDAKAALTEYRDSLMQKHQQNTEKGGNGGDNIDDNNNNNDNEELKSGGGSNSGRKVSAGARLLLQLPRSAVSVLECKKPSVLPVGELTKRAQELLGSYNTLEEYYLSESVKTILRTEDMNTETVDTIFYVSQSSLARSLFTCSTNCVCSALNVFVEAVATKLHEAIIRGLRGGYTQQASPTTAAATPSTSPVPSQSPRSLMDWIQDTQQQQQQQQQQQMQQQQQQQRQKVPTTWVLMNCLEQCAANMARIRDFVQKEAERLFKGAGDEHAMRKIASCCEDIAAMEKRFRMTLADVVDQVGRQQAFPRVRGYVETALAARPTYELSQSDYAQLEATDSAFLQLGLSVAQLSAQYRALLSATNYESVLGLIAGALAEALEAGVTQRRFTQLGVLQLDRDLRTLQAQLTPLNPRLVREKLARLSQVVLFLGVDRVEEAAELWCESAGRTTWRLAPAEVKKVLLLRVDFTKDRVSRIKLN